MASARPHLPSTGGAVPRPSPAAPGLSPPSPLPSALSPLHTPPVRFNCLFSAPSRFHPGVQLHLPSPPAREFQWPLLVHITLRPPFVGLCPFMGGFAGVSMASARPHLAS